ncbi:unnamed protein product [Trifolium pratense]|uniref:Uncharacterized protein n=1 Tax=Trifolium pratense TaxID=57577 RepID=A0ACB0JK88_TRIPR|nr:unnamed protein product [Trifolium pratense]
MTVVEVGDGCEPGGENSGVRESERRWRCDAGGCVRGELKRDCRSRRRSSMEVGNGREKCYMKEGKKGGKN